MPLPASIDTGTAFCFLNKEEAEMRRTDDVTLSLTLKQVRSIARAVGYPSANFGNTTTPFSIYGLLVSK